MSDFLVVYEEDDDGTPVRDTVLLPRAARTGDGRAPAGATGLELEQDLQVELQNRSGGLAHAGLAASIVGAILALAALGTFAAVFPQSWYGADGLVRGGGLVRGVLVAALVGFLLLLAGAVTTVYGRRIQATGRLERLRVLQRP